MGQAYPLCSSPSSTFYGITPRISSSSSYSFTNLKLLNFHPSPLNPKSKTFIQPTFSSLENTIPQVTQPINSLEHVKLDDPDAKSSPLSKTHIWVNPKSPKSKRNWKNSDDKISSLVKLAKSLDSCQPNEQHVFEILMGNLGDSVTERDAKHILHNLVNPETAILALKYFQQKIELDRHVTLYNVIFKLFGETSDFEKAEKLFDEMLQRGVKPNVLTFSTLIRCAAVCSLPLKVVELFERMPSFGCEPGHNVFSFMICIYSRIGNVDMALSLYDHAKKEKWCIETAAFSSLIKMYGKLGNSDGCLSVYNDMKVLGTMPNMIMYNALLYSMGRAKRAREAKVIYKEMKKNGFSPNWSTYAALLEAFSRARFSKDALSVYKTMKEKGMVLNKYLYSMLLDMYADIGYADEAVQIFEDMKRSETCQPDSYIYSTLINMYSCSGKISEAEAMLNEMIDNGFEPNIFVLTMFVHCYGKAKQTDDVVKIFNQLLDLGITPDDRLCDCLLFVLTQIPKQDHGKITDCIEKANPKLVCVVRCLMEEKEGNGDFRKEALELFNSADDDVKKYLCSSLIDLCVSLDMQHRARNLLDLGLTLEIYKDIQSRSETQWSLNLKGLSSGTSLTALHVWINDLSKALESGEELPPQLGIFIGRRRHKSSATLSVIESYLKEHNAPFQKDTDMAGWYLNTKEAAKSWLQSRGSTETVASLNSSVLSFPTMALSH